MALRLSILIATIPGREAKLNKLLKSIMPLPSGAELIIDPSMEYNIGTKRNKLLAKAEGNYIVFIDDDDHIIGDYVGRILEATETNPDCIGISGIITINNRNLKQWHISKAYGRWFEDQGIYYRTPNHISPVKREIALKAGFPEIAFGEDAEYSKRLLPFLKTEVCISDNIYHYDYHSNKA